MSAMTPNSGLFERRSGAANARSTRVGRFTDAANVQSRIKRALHTAFPYKDAVAPGAAHGLTSEQLLVLCVSLFRAREDAIRLGRDDQLREAVMGPVVMALYKSNRNDRANPCS
jgi:hypothetical protein